MLVTYAGGDVSHSRKIAFAWSSPSLAIKHSNILKTKSTLAPTLSPPRPRRLARDLSALLGGQFLRPSFAAETRKLGSVPGK
jgi:hypothetical protein